MTDPVSLISQIVLMIFALWLLCIAYYALSAPAKAKKSIGKFGSTPFIHFGEHILRTIIGLALVGASDVTQHSRVFEIIGLFLVGTSLMIMILPRSWHHKYAVFWSEKMPEPAIQIAGVVAVLAAVVLVRNLPIAALNS